MQEAVKTQTGVVKVANGAQYSDIIYIENFTRGSLQFPTITSVALTYYVSVDGQVWSALYDSAGTVVSPATIASNRCIPLPAGLASFKMFRLYLGSAEAAERTIAYAIKT
jgi:hypothetical protein